MPTKGTTESGAVTNEGSDLSVPRTGVLVRADNGDVITFDETGLTLRLSDAVIGDIRGRLGDALASDHDLIEVLGDIDAWNVRTTSDWYRFTAALERSTPSRDYQRRIDGGDIIAAAPGPLYGLFSIGGARRAGFNEAPPEFSFHVVSPGDHIGAVGLEGTDTAQPTDRLQRIPHATRDTLIADTLLRWRRVDLRALPLFFARAETDGTASIGALTEGLGYRNFLTAVDNLILAAQSLGKRPHVLAVGIDYSLEDVLSTADEIVSGIRELMQRIERDFNRRGLRKPFFIATFESGTPLRGDQHHIRAHWELAWQHGQHDLAFSAPGYMFEQSHFGRPTEAARIRMAEMDAHAIVALSERKEWLCPLFLLAEYEGAKIRVTARALGDLVIDPADPFGAGPSCGFSIAGVEQATSVIGVQVADNDPQSLILTCDRPLSGPAPELRYAFGAAPSSDAYSANRGRIRDDWSSPSLTGPLLHRWANPAAIPIHPGENL